MPTTPRPRTRLPVWFIAALAVPFLLRLAVVTRPPELLMRLSPLLEDDLFYYLSAAFHLVHGGGLRADAQVVSTGFQPLQVLWAAAAAAPFAFGAPQAVTALLVSEVLLSVGTLALVMRVVRRSHSPQAAGVAALVFAWWLGTLRYANNGLETGLVLWTTVAVLGALLNFFEGAGEGDERHGPHRGAWAGLRLGLVLALAVWVRIDLLAWAGAAVLGALVARHGRGAAAMLRGVVWVLVPPALALGLWLGANLLSTGRALPDSGSAVQALSAAYLQLHQPDAGVGTMLRRAAATVLGESPPGQMFWPLPAAGAAGAALLVVCCTAWLAWRRASTPAQRGLHVAALTYAASVYLFYAIWVPGYWFFGRYLVALSLLFIVLLLPAAVDALRLHLSPRLALALALLLGCAYVVPAARRAEQLRVSIPPAPALEPTAADPLGFSQVCHYVDIARWLRLNVPEARSVALWQGGMVSWFATRELRLTDGVVNRKALEAWTSGAYTRWLQAEGVELLIDFEGVLEVGLAHSASPEGALKALARSECGEPQACVVLYEVQAR